MEMALKLGGDSYTWPYFTSFSTFSPLLVLPSTQQTAGRLPFLRVLERESSIRPANPWVKPCSTETAFSDPGAADGACTYSFAISGFRHLVTLGGPGYPYQSQMTALSVPPQGSVSLRYWSNELYLSGLLVVRIQWSWFKEKISPTSWRTRDSGSNATQLETMRSYATRPFTGKSTTPDSLCLNSIGNRHQDLHLFCPPRLGHICHMFCRRWISQAFFFTLYSFENKSLMVEFDRWILGLRHTS